jgi:hypothetical protein
MGLKVRPLTDQEAHALNRLAHSRTIAHRVVPPAHMIWAGAQGLTVPTIARRVGLSALRVRAWIRCFNREGLAGLAAARREGFVDCVASDARSRQDDVGWKITGVERPRGGMERKFQYKGKARGTPGCRGEPF